MIFLSFLGNLEQKEKESNNVLVKEIGIGKNYTDDVIMTHHCLVSSVGNVFRQSEVTFEFEVKSDSIQKSTLKELPFQVQVTSPKKKTFTKKLNKISEEKRREVQKRKKEERRKKRTINRRARSRSRRRKKWNKKETLFQCFHHVIYFFPSNFSFLWKRFITLGLMECVVFDASRTPRQSPPISPPRSPSSTTRYGATPRGQR